MGGQEQRESTQPAVKDMPTWTPLELREVISATEGQAPNAEILEPERSPSFEPCCPTKRSRPWKLQAGTLVPC